MSHQLASPLCFEEHVRRRLALVRLVAFDFDGVFTDNTVYVDENGREAVRCWRGDGIGLKQLKAMGVDTVVLSTETNPVVGARAKKLGIECVQACVDKAAELQRLAIARHLQMIDVAFVGNDINDLSCLLLVGLPIVVADAHPAVLDRGFCCTSRRGGDGAVREICDWIAAVRQEARGIFS